MLKDRYQLVAIDLGHGHSTHAKINYKTGTPGYRAPEVEIGEPYDVKKADIYSLLLTFLEILYNRPVFKPGSDSQAKFNQFYG